MRLEREEGPGASPSWSCGDRVVWAGGRGLLCVVGDGQSGFSLTTSTFPGLFQVPDTALRFLSGLTITPRGSSLHRFPCYRRGHRRGGVKPLFCRKARRCPEICKEIRQKISIENPPNSFIRSFIRQILRQLALCARCHYAKGLSDLL